MNALPACAAILAASSCAWAQTYTSSVIASGLSAPTGIAVRGDNMVYFTEVPTPGIPGSMGGSNAVKRFKPRTGAIQTVSMGEPEPLNLAVDRGNVYWTCRTAGVILVQNPRGEVGVALQGLSDPTGIAARQGRIYFTQVPTPGVPGSAGGMNTVNVSNGSGTATLSAGEPEPVDIAVAKDGTAYWTCKSAGVILRRTPSGSVSTLLTNLDEPVGIALDQTGRTLFFTEVPTPGVPGSRGGANGVYRVDLGTLQRTTVNFGDPEPTDVAVSPGGSVYWTCTIAGVIVEAVPARGAP
ncbi:MAG: hypothetical protein WD749_12620 [Phycisphaerales bacterium]